MTPAIAGPIERQMLMINEWNDTACVVEILSDKSGNTACLTGVSTALRIPLNDA